MASPWTTTASDNLGQGANSTPAWIVVPDATESGIYSQDDPAGDNGWPQLTLNRKENFDLVEAQVIIGEGAPRPQVVVKKEEPTPISVPTPPAREITFPTQVAGDDNPQVTWAMKGKEYRVVLDWRSPGKSQQLELSDVYVEEGYLYVVGNSSCQGCLVRLYGKKQESWEKLDEIEALEHMPFSLRGKESP